MDVKQKILENVREQGVVQARIKQLQSEHNDLVTKLQRLGGKMEVLQEVFLDETGIDLNQYISENPDFQKQIRDANDKGIEIGDGMAQNAPVSDDKPSKKGLTVRSGNKKIKPVSDKDDEEEVTQVARTRNPPQIVVTDGPPTPDDDDED